MSDTVPQYIVADAFLEALAEVSETLVFSSICVGCVTLRYVQLM